MNWVSILSGFRMFLLLVFAFTLLISGLDLFENHSLITEKVLSNIKSIMIVIYGILYIAELKLVVKQKDNELAVLKTRLLQYEK